MILTALPDAKEVDKKKNGAIPEMVRKVQKRLVGFAYNENECSLILQSAQNKVRAAKHPKCNFAWS